jgi:hypothetical protein
MFDGTTTDVYLVSYRSRLKKLPPLTRLILKESRVGLIYGLYCGWEPASPQTALLAILHGAMPCKVEWARRFGVVIAKGAIPGLHAHLDKRLPGATRGKQRARGEDHAAIAALWNYYEYMAELIKYVVWHNTVQEVPDLAPDDMLLANPPIKPTRVNIYQWLTDRRMNFSLPVDYEALRAFTLPDMDAVIRKNGIYLEAKVHGRKMLLPRLRYTSAELAATGLLSQVKQTGSPIHVRLKMDRNDLSQAWLPTKAGMIRIATSPRDTTILTKLTLDEWILYWEEQVTRNDLAKGTTEQSDADTLLRRLETTATASKELEAEIAAIGTRPPKTKLTRDLDKNRAEELKSLQEQEQAFSRARSPVAAPIARAPIETDEASAADAVMDAYHAQLATA